jgi:hypothetical protein
MTGNAERNIYQIITDCAITLSFALVIILVADGMVYLVSLIYTFVFNVTLTPFELAVFMFVISSIHAGAYSAFCSKMIDFK